jgi:hypothetical protein
MAASSIGARYFRDTGDVLRVRSDGTTDDERWPVDRWDGDSGTWAPTPARFRNLWMDRDVVELAPAEVVAAGIPL